MAADRGYSNIPYFQFSDFFSCPCGLGPWRAFQRRCIHPDAHFHSNSERDSHRYTDSYSYSNPDSDSDTNEYSYRNADSYSDTASYCDTQPNAKPFTNAYPYPYPYPYLNPNADSPDVHTDTYQREQRTDLQELPDQHDQR
jgi:hypothetical protein